MIKLLNNVFQRFQLNMEKPIYLCNLVFCQEYLFILNLCFTGSGGMIGLTEDDDKWRRWQVCSPEVARAVDEKH